MYLCSIQGVRSIPAAENIARDGDASYKEENNSCYIEEKIMLKANLKTILRIFMHVAFCAVVIIIFGTFCKLRTVAAAHPYKEYLSGVIVLGLMYFNYFVLFPVYFKTNRFQMYLLSAIITVLCLSLGEMVMVSMDIIHILQALFTQNEVHMLFLTDCLYVTMRNMVLLFFSFSVAALSFFITQNRNKEYFMVRELQKLDAKMNNKEKTDIHVNIQKVAYVYQQQNYTYLQLTNGDSVFRYGSLKQLKSLLDEQSYIQLSKKTLVMCNNILRYNTSGVVVKNSPKDVLLTYSLTYKDIAMNQLFEKTGLDPQDNSSSEQLHSHSKPRHQQKDKTMKLIYTFITNHPGCSAADIKKNRSISQSTVNRILAQLKKEGFVEYSGSKKTGGYKATGNE